MGVCGLASAYGFRCRRGTSGTAKVILTICPAACGAMSGWSRYCDSPGFTDETGMVSRAITSIGPKPKPEWTKRRRKLAGSMVALVAFELSTSNTYAPLGVCETPTKLRDCVTMGTTCEFTSTEPVVKLPAIHGWPLASTEAEPHAAAA